MPRLEAVAVLFVLLLALEWLFWLSPLKSSVQHLSNKLGRWFYVFPPHYLARLMALFVVLAVWRPALWPAFSGGVNWFYSCVVGLALVMLTYLIGQQTGLVHQQTFVQGVRTWYRQDPAAFVGYLCYLVIYPGLVEELLFRWFFVAALWPELGWWTLGVAPALNIGWHLPVWIDMVRGQGADKQRFRAMMAAIAGPATVFALLLTVAGAAVHNLAGVVLAHAFADWAGEVQRRTPVMKGTVGL